MAVLTERQERSVSSANSNRFSIVHLDQNIGDLLPRASILWDRVLSLSKAVHESMRDALKAIIRK
jgi:hypothetical protein